MAEIILKDMSVLPSPFGPLVPTAHPEGCAEAIRQDFEEAQRLLGDRAGAAQGQHAVIIGGSQGYGAALALSALAAGMDLTVFASERSPACDKRGKWQSSPGYYNLDAIQRLGGDRVQTLVGNIFSDEHKDALMRVILERGGADLLIYSVAAPGRAYQDGQWAPAIKAIGAPIDFVGIDLKANLMRGKNELTAGHVAVATEQEIANMVAVMGGADLEMLIGAMVSVGALKPGAMVAAPSYVGPLDFDVLARMYPYGTLGKAKAHLYKVLQALDVILRQKIQGRALDLKFPAVVTNASKAVPAVLKYLAAYYAAVARDIGAVYQEPIQVANQAIGIFLDSLRGNTNWDRPVNEGGSLDTDGRYSFDEDELSPQTQIPLRAIWDRNDTPAPMDEELTAGFKAYMDQLARIHGFRVPGVDYEKPVTIDPDLFALPGTYNLNAPPPASLKPILIPSESESETPVSEVQLGPTEAFLQNLLGESRSQVTTLQDKEERTVFVHKAPLDPVTISGYARVTRQPDDGTMPASYTFVHAMPAIFSAVGDEIEKRIREGRSVAVIHRSEELSLVQSVVQSVPSDADLESQVWVAKKLTTKDEVTAFILDRETRIGKEVVATGRTTLAIGADPASLPLVYADPAVLEGTNLETVTLNQPWVDDYRRVSGDDNLPHTPEGAAALGWKKPIAHGMFTMGLANRPNPPARPTPYTAYKAAFKGPVVVGESVIFYEDPKNGKITGVKPGPDGKWINVIELAPPK